MTPFSHRAVRLGVRAGFVLLLTLSALFSNLQFQSAIYRLPTPSRTPLKLPKSEILQAASLNYGTFAADIAWVATIVDYGESRRDRNRPKHLLNNAHVIADLDPQFRRLYDWFPAVALARTYRATESDLAEINDFIDRGIHVFPQDGYLPFAAAMNYIGHSAHGSKARRLRESDKAIAYLEDAMQLPGSPSNAPFVLSWFLDRKRKLMGEDEISEADRVREIRYLSRALLSISDRSTRRRIARRLRQMGAGNSIAESARQLENEFEAAKESSEFGFLPDDLWVAISCP